MNGVMSEEQVKRRSRYARLKEHAAGKGEEARTFANVTPDECRYAAVSLEHFAGEHVGGTVWLAESVDEAFALLADDVLGGDEPDGVYDLDTREKIEIAVTVTVARSEDQGTTVNPLEDER